MKGIKAGDQITVMRKERTRYGVEPHPVLVRVEKVGRKYVTGVMNYLDPQIDKVVENNRYSSRWNMEEYELLSGCFDTDLIKRWRKHDRDLREYKEKLDKAFWRIDIEERDKYRNAKGEREAQWRGANPRPLFVVSELEPNSED